MTKIERQIIEAVREDRWSISNHAADRLIERDIELWQVIEGFANGQTIAVQPNARPNPTILRRQSLADGSQVVAVWSLEPASRVAKLVTVYFETP
jgi:hypothetical protein